MIVEYVAAVSYEGLRSSKVVRIEERYVPDTRITMEDKGWNKTAHTLMDCLSRDEADFIAGLLTDAYRLGQMNL